MAQQPVTSQPTPMARHEEIPLCGVDGLQNESVRAERKTTTDFCCGCCWRYRDDKNRNKNGREYATRANNRNDTKVYRRVIRDVDYEFDPDIDVGNDINVDYEFDPNINDGNDTNVDYGFDQNIDERETYVEDGISPNVNDIIPNLDDIIIPNVECVQIEDRYVCTDYSNSFSKNDEPEQVCTNENLYVSESCYTQADSGCDYSNDVCKSNDDNTTYDCSDNYGGSDD